MQVCYELTGLHLFHCLISYTCCVMLTTACTLELCQLPADPGALSNLLFVAGAQQVLTEKQEQVKRMREQREAAAAATQKLLRSICKTGFNCCIVAAPANHPTNVMTKIMPLLAPSASFAVFSNWQQPLAECHLALQQSKQAVNLTLAESWWREYQVLPARTHPTMSTSGTGGYILSGTQIPTQL